MFDDRTDCPELPRLDDRIKFVVNYWDSLRGGKPAPNRIDIQPDAISRHLSRIAILERPRAGTVRMRLVGATLSKRLGMELRGMPFRALFDLDDRARAMDAAEVAITTPAVTMLSLGENASAPAEGMMAILPMTDTLGALTRALVIYSEMPEFDMRRPPARMKLGGAWTLDIPESGAVLPQAPDHSPVAAYLHRGSGQALHLAAAAEPLIGAVEAAKSAEHAAPGALRVPGRPALRVIDGGLA